MYETPITGLVLSGGGARAAYQVGVLRAIARLRRSTAASPRRCPFGVICGTSAGAINAAALAWFIPNGHVVWALALPMAVANVLGSTIGTRLALKRGVGFVRSVFLVVVGALIVKTAWDAWHL